jgi:dihydroflavonol-4-reductase
MATAFVTGANGFIGPHLIAYLLERGDAVVGMVRRTSDLTALAPLFEKHGARLRLVVGDLRDSDSLGPSLDDVDYVFHLGAVLLGTSEAEFRQANVVGTRNLLMAIQHGPHARLKRFLFTSSQAAAGPSPSPEPIDETVPPHPVSWYGETKRDAERVVHEYATHGLPTTIVRMSGVYGEREQLLARPMFPAVQMGLKPQIGNTDPWLSLVYVGDVVRGIVAAAEHSDTLGQTFFLTNPRPYQSSDVLTAIADAFDTVIRLPVTVPVIALEVAARVAEWSDLFTGDKPIATVDKVREAHYQYWTCSPDLARRTFGWVAEVPLKEGMGRTVRYWQAAQERARQAALDGPADQRAIKTYTIALGAGLVEAGLDLAFGGLDMDRLAQLLGFKKAPWWLTAGAIIALFGGLMGAVANRTARGRQIDQFVGGAAVGAGLELANQLVLHWWDWSPTSFGRVPGPWLKALALGGPAGLYPLAINAIVNALHRDRSSEN